MVIVKLAAATICFLNSCYPILYGNDTPVGEFQMVLRITESVGYGGDVIQFYETDKIVYAIHRLWRLNPKQQREQRIKSADPKQHDITKGCINLDPIVYEKLKSCCTQDTLIVER